MKVFICAKCKTEINVRVLEKEDKNYVIKDGNLFCSNHCSKVFNKYLPNNVNELSRKNIKKYKK